MNYTALIIDDEAMGAERLQLLLEKHCPEITVLSVCTRPQLGIDMIREKKPQIVFLDIEMPNISGFNLLEQVKTENFECIFTTAYDQYAINAIKHNALDYLLKPVDVSELKQAVEKAKEKINKSGNNNNNLSEIVTRLLSSMEQKNETHKFSLPVGGEVFFVKADDVLYFEADGNYTHIYLDDGKKSKITSSKNLKRIEETIHLENFLRIHNSHVINVKNVVKFSKGISKMVIMKDGRELSVSKAKTNELVQKLELFFPKLFS